MLNVSKALIWIEPDGGDVKGGRALEYLAVNVLLLAAAYLVTADLASRSAYAAREGLSYHFTQSFFVETSSLQGASGTLQSPLTLAWLQILLAALVVVDAYYLYGWFHRERAVSPNGQ